MVDAHQFWQRVDTLRGDRALKDIAEEFHLNYNTIRDMRARERYPKIETCAGLARSLHTTLDFLLLGEVQRALCPEARYVVEHPEAQALIRAVMRDPVLLSSLAAIIGSCEKYLADKKGS